MSNGRTDSEGRVAFRLVNGEFRVRLHTGQWWEATTVQVTTSKEVEVRLKRLTVRVVDDVTNAPVSGVLVEIRTKGGQWVSNGRTDSEGRVAFRLVNGEFRVRLHTGQWWEATTVQVTTSKEVEVRLKRLTVRVVDDVTNAPVSGVLVEIRTKGGQWVSNGYTDSEGRVVFRLVNGEFRVRVLYHGEWQEAEEIRVTGSTEIEVSLEH